ncbi:hypothetical protein Poli38472_012359 [Pythium oligandrum]|uniref:Uncharacterized protein n=1 Tax=Pythium oligandrum TaxID=41045 RepID=A0A8K1FR51_PYTOL|nr:hypothetical protein Poli38472_012359 [Pythium oligandrum]|eukprot:TMW67243.1 hypothetical protein Poli38472_012359 [Pythium oligandrum]
MQSSNTDVPRSSGSDTEPTHVGPRKFYKTTYYARKDEITSLQAEVNALMAKVTELKEARPEETKALEQSLLYTAELTSGLRATDLVLARAQSALSSYADHTHPRNPLHSAIHLGNDPVERQRTLISLWEPKVSDAVAFLHHRFRAWDLHRERRQTESFPTDSGDHISIHCEVTPFSGHKYTVPQVYHDLNLALTQLETSTGEQLGINVIRQTGDKGGPLVSNSQYLASTADGVTIEKNSASFRALFSEGTELLPCPHGIVVTDSVDTDAMHPYQPQSRVRHDCTLATLVLVCHPGDTPIVTVIRWVFSRLHRPQCVISDQQTAKLTALLPRLDEVAVNVVRQYVTRSYELAL